MPDEQPKPLNIEPLALDLQELYDEVVERATAEGVADQEAWNQLVETALEEHREWEEIDPDQNIELMEDTLKARWSEYTAILEERARHRF